MTPDVTIGLPVYNPGKNFANALRSIFCQTYLNWELLVVDDGTTDGSISLLNTLADPRVKIYSDGQNRGLSWRLNQITQEAQGEIIVRMDADDLMHPNRIKSLVRFLEGNRTVDLVSSAALSLNQKLEVVGRSARKDAWKPSAYEVLKSGGVIHSSIAARRDWFLRHPYRSEYGRAEDRELFARAIGTSRFYYLDEPLYYYVHIGNVRPKAYLQSYSTERRILREYGPKLIGRSQTSKLILRSFAKSVILMLANLFKVENLMFRHQMVGITTSEFEEFESSLATIQATELPRKEKVSRTEG
jgi:glycosyltransferase involved in cell wall biosynthesis